MDRNAFIAVTLCAVIYIGWYNYTSKNFPQPQTEVVTAQTVQTVQQGLSSGNNNQIKDQKIETSQPKPSIAQPKLIKAGAQGFDVSFNSMGAVVSEINIGEYRGTKTDSLKELISASNQVELSTPAADWSYLNGVVYEVKSQTRLPSGADQIVFRFDDQNISVVRTYTVYPKAYFIDHDLSIQFKKQQPNYIFVGMRALTQTSKIENEVREIIFTKNGGKTTFDPVKLDELKEDIGEGKWIGITSRYFISALLDRGAAIKPQFQARPITNNEVSFNLIYRVDASSISIPQRYYFGPKDVEMLSAAGQNLDSAVDFGWFTVFAYPLLKALKWFNGFVNNFGIAIILLTILVKLLLYPLTLKSMKSMKEMQKIQPKMNALREKYKDDKETLNREMMTLMKTNGYNPMSGCLPMFVQMPIFIALYNVLYGAIDLYGQPFFGWIHDLSAKDPFFVTPVLLAAMMFLQQKLTPNTTTDPMQQKMMLFMPLIFGFMMLWLPSGLTLYMLVNSIMSIIQQVIINKKLGINQPITA